jgi:phospholipid/cholesterol/gamma-HCH transport system substrate-binding protein
MSRKESAIEVKVGALVLASVAILVGFVLVLGDFSFKPGFTIYVDFDNAAGLKPGAPVRLAGIPAGSVRSVQFMGGDVDEALGRPVYVRATLRIDEGMRPSLRNDAQFTITTQGVLGEPYVEITSVDRSMPAAENGQVFRGVDPPRLDMLISSAYEGIQGIGELVERLNRRGQNPIRLDDMINNIADLAGNIDERVVENKEEIDSIIANVDRVVGTLSEERGRIPTILANVEGASGEFDRLGASLNRAVGNGSEIRRTLRNVESISTTAEREAEPMLVSIRQAAQTADRILTDNEDEVASILSNVDSISDDLLFASADVRTLVSRLERGEGSIGRLLQDEEIFEDVREFVRELKRRPWRIIWKE